MASPYLVTGGLPVVLIICIPESVRGLILQGVGRCVIAGTPTLLFYINDTG